MIAFCEYPAIIQKTGLNGFKKTEQDGLYKKKIARL